MAIFNRKHNINNLIYSKRTSRVFNNIKIALYKTIDGVSYVVFYDSNLNLKLACCYLDELEAGFKDVNLKLKIGTTNQVWHN